jgi:hypothetical protein
MRSILLRALLGLCVFSGTASSALAEPDPDGSPAAPVPIALASAHASDGTHMISAVRATLFKGGRDGDYVRIDYQVSNLSGGPLPVHRWQFDYAGQQLLGETVGEIPKGQTRAFSKAIFGRKVAELGATGKVVMSAGLPRVGGAPGICGNLESTSKAMCEQVRAVAIASGECNRLCQAQDRGLTGVPNECVYHPPVGSERCGVWTSVGCSCSGGLGSRTSVSTPLDLIEGRPTFDSFPPPWTVRNIPD